MVVKKYVKEHLLNEKILTVNYPRKVTIFTANFWKLIPICGGLIRSLKGKLHTLGSLVTLTKVVVQTTFA